MRLGKPEGRIIEIVLEMEHIDPGHTGRSFVYENAVSVDEKIGEEEIYDFAEYAEECRVLREMIHDDCSITYHIGEDEVDPVDITAWYIVRDYKEGKIEKSQMFERFSEIGVREEYATAWVALYAPLFRNKR